MVAEGIRKLDGGRNVVVILADRVRRPKPAGGIDVPFRPAAQRPWDAFVEYEGDFSERGGPRHLLHFGTAFKPAPLHQLDLHIGVGLSRAAVDHFIGVGYSFRFQASRSQAGK